MIEETPGYQMIVEFYGERTARRSGIPLINHVNEGIEILDRLGADHTTMEAFAVHPLFQGDEDLKANFTKIGRLDPMVAAYALEYRNVANDFLSDQITTGPNAWGREETYSLKPMRLSPIPAVNRMLVADKVQNRKDFIAYHQATHARSRELAYYFDLWLTVLEISPELYSQLVKDL
jgi:hypothetical protein